MFLFPFAGEGKDEANLFAPAKSNRLGGQLHGNARSLDNHL
jgi:hypothetical protein